jgi:membrane associated rhomboid family serine protease
MRPASVGFQCPECVAEGQKSVRSAITVFGGSTDGEGGRVTKTLIGVNVAVFVLTVLIGLLDSGPSGATQVLIGSARTSLHTLFASYGMEAFNDGTVRPAGVLNGEYYRLVTAGFLHYGILHLLLNMWVLNIFGREVERLVGRWRFLALYLLCGVGSTIAGLYLAPLGLLAGASGSVFGLFGAMLLFLRRLKLDPRQIVVLIVVNFAFGFFISNGTGFNVSWQGHLGGLITGLVVGGVLAYAPNGPNRTAIQIGGMATVTAALAGLVAIAAL